MYPSRCYLCCAYPHTYLHPYSVHVCLRDVTRAWRKAYLFRFSVPFLFGMGLMADIPDEKEFRVGHAASIRTTTYSRRDGNGYLGGSGFVA